MEGFDLLFLMLIDQMEIQKFLIGISLSSIQFLPNLSQPFIGFIHKIRDVIKVFLHLESFLKVPIHLFKFVKVWFNQIRKYLLVDLL